MHNKENWIGKQKRLRRFCFPIQFFPSNNVAVIPNNLSASGAKREKDVALGITFTSSRFPSKGGKSNRRKIRTL
ncbi:MAG: hypothetical protein LBT50_03695 [Prevotellaceae bacterium]|nr:hypothetical protein [Prevotellaceae bacterium]